MNVFYQYHTYIESKLNANKLKYYKTTYFMKPREVIHMTCSIHVLLRVGLLTLWPKGIQVKYTNANLTYQVQYRTVEGFCRWNIMTDLLLCAHNAYESRFPECRNSWTETPNGTKYSRSQNCEKRLLVRSRLSVCPFVRPSFCAHTNNSVTSWRIFIAFDIWAFFENLSSKLNFG
jgi:hypothetical protein